jgi:probable addiction module antidote protein
MTKEPFTDRERDELLETIRLVMNGKPDSRYFPRVLKCGADMRNMAWLADASGCNRTALFRAMQREANPTLKTLDAILKAFGLRLSAERR